MPKRKLKKIPVSIELCNDYIKLAGGVFSKGSPKFCLIKKEFSSKETENISQEVMNLFKAHKFPTKDILLNIPRYFVMARVLHLPSTNDDEIRKMVEIESARQMPYKEEDIIKGYKIIEKLKDGYSDVLLIIAQAETINRFINILKGTNLTIEKIALSSESLFSWYSMIKEQSEERFENNTALININSDYIDIDIIEKEKLIFTRAFTYSTKDSYVNRDSIDEIKKSIATFQKETHKNVDEILLSGGDNKLKALEPILKEELGILIKSIEQTKFIEIDNSTKTDLGDSSFVDLIGLSLKNKEIEINLFPKDMIEEAGLRSLKKNILTTLILFLSISIFTSGSMIKKISDKSRHLRLVDSEIKAMEPQVMKAKKMKEDIKIIKNVIQKKPLAIDIISEIYKITPTDITYNLLDYESDKFLILKGNASSLDNIIKFITVLEESQYFENVKIKYTSKRSVAGTEKTDFEIICSLSKIR